MDPNSENAFPEEIFDQTRYISSELLNPRMLQET